MYTKCIVVIWSITPHYHADTLMNFPLFTRAKTHHHITIWWPCEFDFNVHIRYSVFVCVYMTIDSCMTIAFIILLLKWRFIIQLFKFRTGPEVEYFYRITTFKSFRIIGDIHSLAFQNRGMMLTSWYRLVSFQYSKVGLSSMRLVNMASINLII